MKLMAENISNYIVITQMKLNHFDIVIRLYLYFVFKIFSPYLYIFHGNDFRDFSNLK